MGNLPPRGPKTPKPIFTQIGIGDYAADIYPCAEFHPNSTNWDKILHRGRCPLSNRRRVFAPKYTRMPTKVTRLLFTLHRMYEMQTIVTDARGVCPSVCLSRGSTVCGARAGLTNVGALWRSVRAQPTCAKNQREIKLCYNVYYSFVPSVSLYNRLIVLYTV